MYLLGAGGAPPPPPAKSNTIINTRKHDILIPLTIATIVSLRPSFLATFANGPGNLDGVFDATFRSPPPPPDGDGDGDGAGLLPLDGAGLLPLDGAGLLRSGGIGGFFSSGGFGVVFLSLFSFKVNITRLSSLNSGSRLYIVQFHHLCTNGVLICT